MDALVVGLGNEHRGDDGVGPAVARRLRGLRRAGVAVVETSGDAATLIDLWDGRDLVVVVDAVRTGSPVGTVFRRESEDVRPVFDLPATSTHGVSLGEAFELGRALGRLPRRLVLYGVEAGDLRVGQPMSPSVARAIPSVVDDVLRETAPNGRPGPARGSHA